MSNFYTKQNPYFASIKERYNLSKPGSKKNTQHLVLDLKGSDLKYEVGDSIGIFPHHDPELVLKTLNAMKTTGNEHVHTKQTQEQMLFFDFLMKKANITDISPKLFKETHHRQKNSEKKHQLELLLQEDNREAFKHYISEHEVWDFLLGHEEVEFTPQEFADLLMPMLPRFYSISSSQKLVGEEVHLTVAPLEYESRGHKRRGVCTHYLCSMIELHNPIIPVFIQPSHGFKPPEDINAPIIMIGPGTGIAPFRAFMQERVLFHNSHGKHWLFFGEWNRDYDFFYEEDWNHFASRSNLKLALAFSRDQNHKIYVQHKMLDHGEELFEWLEGGAYFYVCGDAQQMAKDVELALHSIIQEYGLMDAQASKEYIKKLRHQKRYLRDVY
ncbi:MAG: sulfite reductase [Parachlamydiaceae bacterium]|nr:sulfite reductase [Parachlamydiaceae bacterium]